MVPAIGYEAVVVGLCEEPDVLVQDFSLRHASWAVLSTVMLKLVRYDDRWRPWPELATEIPTRANGGWRVLPDGRTEVRWRLRDGVRWHDGRPVTAHDALFTYELLSSTPPPYPHHTVIESISEMLVPSDDPLTLVVRWRADRPFAPFEEWGTVLPRHLLAGEDLHRQEVRDVHPFLRAPTYNGAYWFEEWVEGSHLSVRANGEHPRGCPVVERIVFRFYPGPEELREAVIAGEVDVTDLTSFSPADGAYIAERAPQVEVRYTDSLLWEHIDCNLDDPVLADRRVRHALAHAIDVEEISRELHSGVPKPASSWLPPSHPAYQPAAQTYPHDPERARNLLREAGFTDGPDGVLVDRAGEPLSLSLLTTKPAATGRWTASSTRPEAALMLQRQLGRVGVDLRVELAPADEAFPRFRRRQFPHLAMFAWSMGMESNGYLLWHSSKIPDENEWYGINVCGWRDAENDALLDAMTTAEDDQHRWELMRAQQLVWSRELPSLPLFFPPGVTTGHRGLSNVRPVGIFGSYVTWNAWEWRWTEAS